MRLGKAQQSVIDAMKRGERLRISLRNWRWSLVSDSRAYRVDAATGRSLFQSKLIVPDGGPDRGMFRQYVLTAPPIPRSPGRRSEEMTDEEIESELTDIADTAEAQVDGRFSVESDAIAALKLVERLARLMLTLTKETPVGPV